MKYIINLSMLKLIFSAQIIKILINDRINMNFKDISKIFDI